MSSVVQCKLLCKSAESGRVTKSPGRYTKHDRPYTVVQWKVAYIPRVIDFLDLCRR